MPVGHQFILDAPGTSCQEEFLRDSMPRGILTVSETMPFIEKGDVSSVIKDAIFHILEPS